MSAGAEPALASHGGGVAGLQGGRPLALAGRGGVAGRGAGRSRAGRSLSASTGKSLSASRGRGLRALPWLGGAGGGRGSKGVPGRVVRRRGGRRGGGYKMMPGRVAAVVEDQTYPCGRSRAGPGSGPTSPAGEGGISPSRDQGLRSRRTPRPPRPPSRALPEEKGRGGGVRE